MEFKGLPERALNSICMVLEAALDEGFDVERVIVFGSYARGDWMEYSDLDLILVGRSWRGSRVIDRLDPIYRRLARMKPPVWPEIHCYTPEELESLMRAPTILADASRYWVELEASEVMSLCKGLRGSSRRS